MDFTERLNALKVARYPLTFMPLPTAEEGEQVVVEVVLAVAKLEGKEPEDVKIPMAIPECYGFYEAVDPACKECPYKVHCVERTVSMQPRCFNKLYSLSTPACANCILAPWCGTVLVVQP